MDHTLVEIDRKIRALEAELSMVPLCKRLRELESLRERHVQHLTEVKRLLGGLQPPSGEPVAKPVSVKHAKLKRNRGVKSKTSPTDLIIGMACRVLAQHGKPMGLAPLYTELVNSGIVIGGADPKANLSTKLSSAKDKVYNEKNLGWWLIERKSDLSQKQESLANGVARLS